MAFETGGMADKLGNRYEGRWVAKQLLRLLNEEIYSVTVELISPDERGVDLLVVKKDGTRQLQQCKARLGSQESWTISDLRTKDILDHLKYHLIRDPKQEFTLVSAIPGQSIADICESARNSNDNPNDFFQYQIQKIGKNRRTIYHDFCSALELDTAIEDDRRTAFEYLKRTYIELFQDNKTDLLTWAGFLLTGEPETAISALLTYAENDKYRKPIYVDELRWYLADHHGIYPKCLEHDRRLAPAVNELQKQFSESIRPRLIFETLIPRAETSLIIKSIYNGQDVVVHGAAGNGKTGVLCELSKYLDNQHIPYIPIRLDRRIPDNNAKQFGEDLGLPESPANSLAGLAVNRKGVLILDQLDAIRWTAAHSSLAMDVCKELVRQVRSLRHSGNDITIVFACRTFDLENDPEIKNLLSDNKGHDVVKILIGEFSEKQLEEIIGPDIHALAITQKRILSCPQNLSIWIELKKEGALPSFRSATELMRRFWENRRKILGKIAGITTEQIDSYLKPLLDYMEGKGEISAPASIAAQNPSIRDILKSFGVLQSYEGRIIFCHQQYLDYLIAERLLQRIYQGVGSVLDWLGAKQAQSLFRREQLRQVLALLADESPTDFLSTAKELLESSNVRFHIKHLILELISQLDNITNDIGTYILELLSDHYWKDHILETVFPGHHSWVSYLLDVGVIQKWLESTDEQEINRALWILRTVGEFIPDRITAMLTPFLNRGGQWRDRVLNTICWNVADDSENMFELRLELLRMGHVGEFVDWKSLCDKNPIRALQLIEGVVSNWSTDDDETIHKRGRLEKWYDHDLEALNNVVIEYPAHTWDLLMPHVDRLTSIQANGYDPTLQRWEDKRFSRHETDIERGVVELLILACKTLAKNQPNELTMRITPFAKSISKVIKEIIIAGYACLPTSHADEGVSWLLVDPSRFQSGSGYHEPEWMPAVRLIKALSPYCSNELFQRLEYTVIHYHDPDEKRHAEYYMKGWREDYFNHYWGKTQYFLLPALDARRIQQYTANLICVLNRKFEKFSKKRFLRGSTGSGGWVGSKLDPNLEKISDNAWLQIVTNKNISERGNHKWIQVDPKHVLETSIYHFSSSLSRIAKRLPERFGQLALRFPADVHPSYVSAILDGFGKKQPDSDVPESEKLSWMPAQVETIEAVLDKYQSGEDQETARSFCRFIAERADENWSDKTIARLVHYACDHPDLELGKLNIHCDKNSDEAAIEILFQNTINCVRGVAAGAIGELLWKQKDLLEQVKTGIESLISDPHPVVRMAAIEAIEPVLNIDRDLAVRWFYDACKDDLRVAASPRASRVFNYIIPSHIDLVGPIIRQMTFSSFKDVAQEGARQVTARHLFFGLFEKEYAECRMGTVPQRKGVADVAASLLHDVEYSRKCQELIRQFMNDPEKDVRDELRGVIRKRSLLNEPEYEGFIKEYIRSLAFADDPNHFIWTLKDFTGSLIPISDIISTVCVEISTTLKEKARDDNSMHHYDASEVASILLRLYEQAQGIRDTQTADRCLDIWDLLFENRVGRTRELTRTIEQ